MEEAELVHDPSPTAVRTFTKAMLRDLQALERMLGAGTIESGVRRIGAEQEVFLVNDVWQPACAAMEVLARLPSDGPYTTELAQFNLEMNLEPVLLEGSCFRNLEEQLLALLAELKKAGGAEGAKIVLAGILPTLSKTHLSLDNISPKLRYYALNEATTRMTDGAYRLRIMGVDELHIEHDNVMLESCNTSFQFHLQVSAEEFPQWYNAAQVAIGPLLACSVNSPLLFGRRLWAETRIALFQQSIDTRSSRIHTREMSPRVRFGERWVEKSVVELFQEDIARFQVLMTKEVEEDPLARLEEGGAPRLEALQLHNSTVYRWNRPCYGILDGTPHLRIECRALPSGPSALDEVANGAFWVGLVAGLVEEHGDVTSIMKFDHAKSNFLAAAREGLSAGFTWADGEILSVRRLLLETLLPMAERGLERMGVHEHDVDRYLGVIRSRVESGGTGAAWMVRSLAEMDKTGPWGERLGALTAAIYNRQEGGEPGHHWELATLDEVGAWRYDYLTVEQYMTTSLFTVNDDELVELVAFLMDRNQIRHILVEDEDHELVGLVSYRSLIRLMAQGGSFREVPVKEIMEKNPWTVPPEMPTVEAIGVMRQHRISCLPVIKEGKLVGLVSERDFMPIAYKLLDERLKETAGE